MSRRHLCELLEIARAASTADSKGKSLETLSEALFESANCAKVKYRRLLTSSSEIDLVVEILSSHVPPVLAHYGRYGLIECRNWARPVGAASVRDFISKVKATRCKLGIMFSANGVTGTDSGADALREIQRACDVDDIHIAVVTDQDLQRAEDGGSFVNFLDEVLDSLRFNLR